MTGPATNPSPSTPQDQATSLDTESFIFDLKDLHLFRGEDIPYRLQNLQNNLFPRFRRLVSNALSTVQDVYGKDAGAGYTIFHHPTFRKDAANPVDTDQVMVGIAPRRDNTPLEMRKPDGTPYRMGPGQLLFRLRHAGGLQTVLQPYRWSDQEFRVRLHEEIAPHWPVIQTLLAYTNVCATLPRFGVPPGEALLHAETLLQGPPYPVPLVTGYAQRRLLREFVVLFPILDAGTRLARNHDSRLHEHMDLLLDWFEDAEEWLTETEEQQDEELREQVPGYATIRPRRWYSVLMRDKWRCCSCGRSSTKDGVTLEVDHVVPRSKGGTNDEKNLQTLCRKCNSGKSNLDDTPLRDLTEVARTTFAASPQSAVEADNTP